MTEKLSERLKESDQGASLIAGLACRIALKGDREQRAHYTAALQAVEKVLVSGGPEHLASEDRAAYDGCLKRLEELYA